MVHDFLKEMVVGRRMVDEVHFNFYFICFRLTVFLSLFSFLVSGKMIILRLFTKMKKGKNDVILEIPFH